jgi:hypothetical protein
MSRFIEELESRLLDPEQWNVRKDIPNDMLDEVASLIEKGYQVAIGQDKIIGYFVLFMKEDEPKEEKKDESLHEGKDTDQESSLPCKGT